LPEIFNDPLEENVEEHFDWVSRLTMLQCSGLLPVFTWRHFITPLRFTIYITSPVEETKIMVEKKFNTQYYTL
jgi:hypothetical protein